MLIHEVRRRADEAPEHDFAGHKLQFKANAAGDVVCDVPDEIAEDLLAAVGSAMAPYGVAPAAKAAVVPAAAPKDSDGGTADGEAVQNPDEGDSAQRSQFTVTSPDDTVYDLGPMSDDEVREFAVAQGLAKPHHSKKGDKLRQFVIDSLKGA